MCSYADTNNDPMFEHVYSLGDDEIHGYLSPVILYLEFDFIFDSYYTDNPLYKLTTKLPI